MKRQLAVVIVVVLANLVAPGNSMVMRMNKRGVWHNPCGKTVTTSVDGRKPVGAQRHEVTKRLKAITTQLGIATTHYKNEESNIDAIYAEVAKSKFVFQFNWLPQNQMQWYKNEARCLKKPERIQQVLKKLHSSLQNFSVTFQALLNFLKPDIYPPSQFKNRTKFMDGIDQHLVQVLCEVDSAMVTLGIERPSQIEDNFLANQTGNWHPKPDYTQSKIQDWGVISLYTKFLVDWHFIMEKVNKNTACKRDGGKKKKRKQ